MAITKPSEPQRPTDSFPGSNVRHGTRSGWTKHQNEGTDPCDACYRAKEQYDSDWRKQPRRVKISRRNARAQGIANKALRRAHPGEYARLYADAKAELIAQEQAET